jgi:hypothetical protein
MREHAGLRWVETAGLALVALGLTLASAAGAKQFNVTGSWVIREGNSFLPLQFPQTAVSMAMTWHATGTSAQGGPLNAVGFPNGPVVGSGVVTASGGTTSIMLPQGLFHSFPSTVLPLYPITGVVQISTMFEVLAPFEAATLRKSGGPGSFTWCPTNPACTVGQALNGIGRGNSRVIYLQGSNRFGGTLQVGLGEGGANSFVYQYDPFQVGHVYFGAPDTLVARAIGAGAPDLPLTGKVYLSAGVATQPLALPMAPNWLVTQPGGKVTTGMGVTTEGGTGPLVRFEIGTTPGGMSFGQLTTSYGFPHTTGTVIVQQTGAQPGAGDDFFTLMG